MKVYEKPGKFLAFFLFIERISKVNSSKKAYLLPIGIYIIELKIPSLIINCIRNNFHKSLVRFILVDIF